MASGNIKKSRRLIKMNIRANIVFIFVYLVFSPFNIFGSLPQNILEDIQKEVTKLVEITRPSVVTISSKSSHSYILSKDNGFLSIFKENKVKRTVSYNNICSGLIYNNEGYIVTRSWNISEDGDVILYDGTRHKPTFIGQDQETGIAVLKIDTENLSPARLGNSEKVSIGSWATIIGNSMGILPSISFGLVNGVLRNGLIQLSAIVSPGNSGSPVFNNNGEVIGILAAQVEVVNKVAEPYRKNLFTEIGLAFPINKTCEIAEKIIKSYKEQIGWIGIQLQPDSLEPGNLKLINIIPDSPADKAGLKKGDRLIKYNNIALSNPNRLGELIRNTNPGSTVPISFIRYNNPLNVFVTVSKKTPYVNKRIPPGIVKFEGYYQKTFQPLEIDTSLHNVSKLQNKVKRLEREIFQLKTILNRQQEK